MRGQEDLAQVQQTPIVSKPTSWLLILKSLKLPSCRAIMEKLEPIEAVSVRGKMLNASQKVTLLKALLKFIMD
jgi:hypothetical protein